MRQNRQPRRVRLSLVVARTHRMLVGFLLSLFVAIGFGYLFWVNHIGIQGYSMSRHMKESISLQHELTQMDARIAAYSASEFLLETDQVETMAERGRNNYLVLRDVYTAQK